MADYTPIFSGGAFPFTSQASGAITGGTLVVASGNSQVATAGAAAGNVIGVAAHDATTGQKVTVWPLPGVTHEVVAGAIVAAGDKLAAAASGQVAPIGAGTFDALIGIAVAGAASAALCRFIGR